MHIRQNGGNVTSLRATMYSTMFAKSNYMVGY